MDAQQSNKSSKEISEIKYNSMYIQNPYKSSERKSKLLEKIDEWLLEYDIKELKNSLNEIIENIKERAGIPGIKESYASISLYCCKSNNGSIRCKYDDSTIEIYKKGKKISCKSNIPSLPDKLECTNYSNKSSFELSNLYQRFSSIKDKILDIHKTAYPEVLMNLDNQSITIAVDTYMYFDKSVKEPPVIIKDNNSLIFDMGNFYIRMYWRIDGSCKF